MTHLPANPRRRRLLGGTLAAGALSPLASLSFAASAAAGEKRLVFMILRGGMDGLYAVPAVGDPHFAPARGVLAQYPSAPLPLSAPFALHPALVQLHAMYGRGEMAVVHAVGLPYLGRSHFDAQNLLETGGQQPFSVASGWLGRALGGTRAVALSTTTPMVLRGAQEVDTWAPSVLPSPDADLLARLERMYAGDGSLGPALQRARALRMGDGMMASAATASLEPGMMGGMGQADSAFSASLVKLAQRAAEFLGVPGGPRVAVLEQGGWDSHGKQNDPQGPIANHMRTLDTALGALRQGLLRGDAWRHTTVVVATEFGREVAVNGTLGTDHGSGGAAFILGGAIQGGRVIADWPGLAPRDRFEGRDLRVTTDLRAVLKGALAEQLNISQARLDSEIFPGSAAVRPLAIRP